MIIVLVTEDKRSHGIVGAVVRAVAPYNMGLRMYKMMPPAALDNVAIIADG